MESANENYKNKLLSELLSMGFDEQRSQMAVRECCEDMADESETPDSRSFRNLREASILDACITWILSNEIANVDDAHQPPHTQEPETEEQNRNPALAFFTKVSKKMDTAAGALSTSFAIFKDKAVTAVKSGIPGVGASETSVPPLEWAEDVESETKPPPKGTFVIGLPSTNSDESMSQLTSTVSESSVGKSPSSTILRKPDANQAGASSPKKVQFESSNKTSHLTTIEDAFSVTSESSNQKGSSSSSKQLPEDSAKTTFVHAYGIPEIHSFYERQCRTHCEKPIEPVLSQMEKCFASDSTFTVLDLTGTHIHENNVSALESLLGLSFGLIQLNLSCCSLEDHVLKRLLNALLISNTIAWLNLSGNALIRAPGFKSIAVLVKKSKHLKYLDISGIHVDDRSVKFMNQALSPNENTGLPPPLAILKLGNCRLRAEQLNLLAVGVHQSNISHLSFINNKMPFDCAPALAFFLSLCNTRSLVSLDLGGNAPLHHNFETLTRALASNTTLQYLSLRENDLDASNLTLLCASLSRNSKSALSAISLDGNSNLWKSGAAGLGSFAPWIETSKILKELSLAGCALDDRVVEVLAKAIAESSSLRRLNLERNPIGLTGLKALLNSVESCKSLIQVIVLPVVQMSNADTADQISETAQLISKQCHIRKERIIATMEKCSSTPSSTDPNWAAIMLSNERAGFWFTDGEDALEQSILRNNVTAPEISVSRNVSEAKVQIEHSGTTTENSGFSLAKFKEDFAAAEEHCLLLCELIQAEEDSGSGANKDIIKQLSSLCRKFQANLQTALNQDHVEDQDLMCLALDLNDRISVALGADSRLRNARLEHQQHSQEISKDEKRGQKLMNGLAAKVQGAVGKIKAHNAKPSRSLELQTQRMHAEVEDPMTPGVKDPQELSVLTAALTQKGESAPAVRIFSEQTNSDSFDEQEFPISLFNTASADMPPAQLCLGSEDVKASKKSQNFMTEQFRSHKVFETQDSESFFPLVPPAQILVSVNQGKAVVSKSGHNEKLLLPALPKSISLTSFEDVNDSSTLAGSKVLYGKGDEHLSNDEFLSDLETQMKDLDQFLEK
ncbi:hypothetical protein HDU81_000056 [Chytriomyces hyalinus]|nr:hypothetical protein HDU81_000056 [Chytriomyces hyalinus]